MRMKVSKPIVIAALALVVGGGVGVAWLLRPHSTPASEATTTTPTPRPAPPVTHNNVTLNVTAPLINQVIDSSLPATVTVGDAEGKVAKIEYLLGDKVVGTVEKAPYHATLATDMLPNGAYTLIVRALDRQGAVLVSQSIAITITHKPSATAKLPASGAPAPTDAASPSAPATLNVAGLSTLPWFGGANYYSQFGVAAAAGWANQSFFPIGAWYMRANTQPELDTYKAMGFNTSVSVEQFGNLPLMRANGIFAIANGTGALGSETTGYVLSDEPDMVYRAGNDPWSGSEGWNTCTPIQDNGGKCGYTYMQQTKALFPANDGRFHYANYGKGVFPWWMTDGEFGTFVNAYTSVVSDDIYWYTDDDTCVASQGPSMIQGSGPISIYTGLHDLTASECHRAANYGAVMDRMRMLDGLDGKRQPIYAFIEAGAPFSGRSSTITGPQMEGAIMSSLIHGANGIIYFKHSFGGSCISNDIFITCPSAPKANATKINGYMRDFAPVLNSPSYQHDFGTRTDTMLKWYNGSAYIFAMGKWGATGSATFTLPGGLAPARSIEVLYEGRTLPVNGGSFTDSFAQEYSYHIYKVVP